MNKEHYEKYRAHYDEQNRLYDVMKVVEERLRAKGISYGEILEESAYDDAFRAWQTKRNSCPQCGSTRVELRDYDMMWHDGEIHCTECGTWVRSYDAG